MTTTYTSDQLSQMVQALAVNELNVAQQLLAALKACSASLVALQAGLPPNDTSVTAGQIAQVQVQLGQYINTLTPNRIAALTPIAAPVAAATTTGTATPA